VSEVASAVQSPTTRNGVIVAMSTQEDWLHTVTADPAFYLKRLARGRSTSTGVAFECAAPRKCYAYHERDTLRGRVTKTRVLIAFEDEYRTYREFLESAVRTHRPHIEVVAAGLATLGEEVRGFDPHLVICSRLTTVDPGGSPA
jgi:hypothetical protein